MYVVKMSKQALKDREKILNSPLSKKVKPLIELLTVNPYQSPPPYEKLVGNLSEFYSRRLNLKHRLVYTVHEDIKTVVIRSLWTHYENI